MDTATFDILPVGSSLARSPYFTFYEYGKELPYSYSSSWETAMNDAFSQYAFPGGYTVLYLTDGDILCASCARAHYMDTGERLDHAIAGDNWGTGEYCGRCDAIIVEPGCADCGDEYGDGFHEPTFVKDSGEAQICARCMARHVVNGDTDKVGKLAYDVGLNVPWYGGGHYTAP